MKELQKFGDRSGEFKLLSLLLLSLILLTMGYLPIYLLEDLLGRIRSCLRDGRCYASPLLKRLKTVYCSYCISPCIFLECLQTK